METGMIEKSKDRLDEAYDYTKYPAGLTGYTGFNFQQIGFWDLRPATRVQVGRRGLYKSGLAQLPNGDLLMAPYSDIGSDRQVRIYPHRSTDAGMTWKPIGAPITGLQGREPSVICLRDGTLLLGSAYELNFFRSQDGGQTWQYLDSDDNFSQVKKQVGEHQGAFPTRNILEEQDGTLALMVSVGSDGDTFPTPRAKAWIFRSRDGGRTWPESQEVSVWDRPEALVETSMVRLSEGGLLATFRIEGSHVIGNTPPPRGLPYPPGDESGGHMLLMNSDDNGIHWTEPREFLNYSEVHGHLAVLKDGKVLCTYANYHLPFGLVAILSNDQGKTWDKQHPIQLAIAADMWTGWPTSLQLPDGSIITSYARSAYLEHTADMGQSTPDFAWNRRNDVVAEVVRWQLPAVVK
jgi:hypothetical protein